MSSHESVCGNSQQGNDCGQLFASSVQERGQRVSLEVGVEAETLKEPQVCVTKAWRRSLQEKGNAREQKEPVIADKHCESHVSH